MRKLSQAWPSFFMIILLISGCNTQTTSTDTDTEVNFTKKNLKKPQVQGTFF